MAIDTPVVALMVDAVSVAAKIAEMKPTDVLLRSGPRRPGRQTDSPTNGEGTKPVRRRLGTKAS